jgi:hypothetical protein
MQLEFTGSYYKRSSAYPSGSRPRNVPPGERELLELNPDRLDRIRAATGWSTMERGSLNLAVSPADFAALLSLAPALIEPAVLIRYPSPHEWIPVDRAEYRYYLATASFGDKSHAVLARRAKTPAPNSFPVELFATDNLSKYFDLEVGDTIRVRVRSAPTTSATNTMPPA